MIKLISIVKGKIAFQVFLIVLFRWTTFAYQFNLYDTDQRLKSHPFQYDCLNYHIRRDKLAFQDLSDVIDEVIPYCIRPTNNSHKSFEDFVDPFSQKLNFEELRQANINALQLLSWSMSIEVVERYQFYLNKPDSALNEEIYNCTPARFGLECQYSFEFSTEMSFNEIIESMFHGRVAYPESLDMVVQVPCYILLECRRNGQFWCLDWREICDGVVDCFDEEVDEKYCFDIEINECNDDEYRCHNGLCIPREFWENGMGDTDCLDRSDTTIEISYTQSCFQDPTFRCEEHSCEISVNPFSCGDGQCVPKLRNCHNGRHVLPIESLIIKGNLKEECWIAMICLTKLVKRINEISCEVWSRNNTVVLEALEKCGAFFQFPTVPVYSHHVRLFYVDPQSGLNTNLTLMPNYVCYDPQLCDAFTPHLVYENETCIDAINVTQVSGYQLPWYSLISSVQAYFRVCSISYSNLLKKAKYNNYSSLYNCPNSSKLISKHRIMDDKQDCSEGEDETYMDSCQLNDTYRVKCANATQCWSPLVTYLDACRYYSNENIGNISFETVCDGINEYFYDNDGQIHDDEFGCGSWLCDNMYTRCDGFWTCSDGRDESNCIQSKCPSNNFACISPDNYTVYCLPSQHVNDSIPDCFMSLDEQSTCRTSYASKGPSFPLYCLNNDRCLQLSKLCDNNIDCPDETDENEKLCNNHQLKCDNDSAHNLTDIEEVICGLKTIEDRKVKYFSVYTSSNYPSLEKILTSEFTYRPRDQHSTKNENPVQLPEYIWPWYCNRGLVLHDWIENNRTCLCPPSYYSDLCQYQNQRISLTIRLTSNDRYATYAIVSMLIDDNDEQQQIHAFDQSVYIAKESCSIKLNRYLLFPTRPKDIDKNYTVRIDVFEKNAITYIGSWYFPIPFLFLPVNRLSIALNLSNHVLEHSINCSHNCIHGECIKYVNKPKYFCRCLPTWSGIQCNTSIEFTACSANSVSIGSINNRSICVCPINQFGLRCSLTSKCPINACQNNGRCIPADVTIPHNSYTWLCPDQYFGRNCELRKAALDVSFRNIRIPSYLIAYFFTLSNKSEPIETTVLRKLTLFQQTVTFHIAAPFQLTFIQIDIKYYLASLQQSPKTHISTFIDSKQECIPIAQLLNSTILALFQYQRIIHFHILCHSHDNLTCFVDKDYLCLCTNDHHANCLEFNQQRNFTCPLNSYCENDGKCLQDHPTCPSTKICLCPSCFFGNLCQFYAKGLGSTLDEILGYEIKRNAVLSKQPITVQVAAAITLILFFIGLVNSILSIITFTRPKSQEIGAGRYLLASSVTSLFTSIALIFKFWFLFHSHQDSSNRNNILRGNCFGIEAILKVLVCLDAWLNACAAIERTITVILGISFNKQLSKRIAPRIISILMLIIIGLYIPQFIHLHIFNDEMEERSWCVVIYVKWLANYSSILMFIHYFVPLAINVISIPCIMIIHAKKRSQSRSDRKFCFHLQMKIRKNKHLIISSTLIICLTLPHLIISIILDCQKSSHLFWFYLIGYYMSFCPAAFVFVIFVLPTGIYRQAFNQFTVDIRKLMTRNERSQLESRSQYRLRQLGLHIRARRTQKMKDISTSPWN